MFLCWQSIIYTEYKQTLIEDKAMRYYYKERMIPYGFAEPDEYIDDDYIDSDYV